LRSEWVAGFDRNPRPNSSESAGNPRLSALHVGFLARARACRCPLRTHFSLAGLARRSFSEGGNRPSETSCEGLSGQLGMPSRIVRLSPHGSSLPGGSGLANLPGAVANRIGDATASLRLTRTSLEDAPQERRYALCSTSTI